MPCPEHRAGMSTLLGGARRSNQGAGYVIQRDGRLPPLSWLFRLGIDGDTVLTCGRGVDCATDGFFEGAWAGHFSEYGFHGLPDVFGTGAGLTDVGWMLLPPSHHLEAIYVLKATKDRWLASNSLAFLLTAADADLLFRWPRTLLDFTQIVNGIAGSPYRTLTSQGNLSLLYHHNALLGSQLKISPKPSSPLFTSFQDYRNYLADVMVATAENAAHPDRRQRYRLLATLSSGYDSAACAAIAREAGCCEGLTFLQSTEGLSDDGSKTGEHIGLQMIGVRHPLFSDTDNLDTPGISEFFTTGGLGEEVTYATVSGLLRERLLVTGFGGEMWDLQGIPMSRNGSSLSEFRLRENFIHLPLPFVGALQRAAVHTISNSPEMDPYKIGGNYDRPIPRRILEEAGVPRALFRQHKRAISTVLYGVYPKRPMPKSLH